MQLLLYVDDSKNTEQLIARRAGSRTTVAHELPDLR